MAVASLKIMPRLPRDAWAVILHIPSSGRLPTSHLPRRASAPALGIYAPLTRVMDTVGRRTHRSCLQMRGASGAQPSS